jgi:hypothetical protein
MCMYNVLYIILYIFCHARFKKLKDLAAPFWTPTFWKGLFKYKL